MHPDDRFRFEGLDKLQEDFLQLDLAEVDYIRIYERDDSKSDSACERFNFHPSQLHLDEEEAAEMDLSIEDYADAFFPSFVASVQEHARGGKAKMRVRACCPKGVGSVWTRTVTCIDTLADRAIVMPPPVEPEPDRDEPEVGALTVPPPDRSEEAEGFYWVELAYRKLIDRQLTATGRLTQLYDNIIVRLDKRLDKSEDQNEKVITALLDYRALEAERAFEHAATEGRDELAAQVAHSALEQIGGAARMYMAAQTGTSPELLDLVELVGQHPKLVETLKQPAVRELLRDPETVEMISVLIEHTAQARAAEAAQPAEPTSSEGPSADGPTDTSEPPAGGPL
ncbi:MAG: hypothetical protein EP330_08610 [Deltaproteobacteria bacterium]|nr:MAG: hypothetical protein EP330_08610 [Deltaproteobacteria bacterium]